MCQINRHSTKQAHMQGGLWNQYTDPIEDEIYTQNKDKIRGQKSFKDDTKCIIYTHRRSDRAIQSMQSMNTDLLGNPHPLKVDRNLQWMSHHPINPTYNPVL